MLRSSQQLCPIGTCRGDAEIGGLGGGRGLFLLELGVHEAHGTFLCGLHSRVGCLNVRGGRRPHDLIPELFVPPVLHHAFDHQSQDDGRKLGAKQAQQDPATDDYRLMEVGPASVSL